MKELFIRVRNNMNMADFAFLKTALLSLGAIAGLLVPKKQKKNALTCASVVYSISIAALIARCVCILNGNPGKEIDNG